MVADAELRGRSAAHSSGADFDAGAPIARLPYRRDIHLLRGFAVVLVVLYHAGLGFSGGYVGVDVFFVISGFLICSLLLLELESTGTIRLVRFWARRVRRLVPAAVLVLVAVWLWSALVLPSFYLDDVGQSLASAAVYFSNMWWAGRATDYLATSADPEPLLHFWSLSVEEQFYIAFPLALVLGVLTLNRRVASQRVFQGVLSVVFVASLVAALHFTVASQPMAFFSPLTRAWQFAAGGLVGVLGWKLTGRTARWAAGGGLLLILYSALAFGAVDSYPGLYAFVPTAGTVLILAGGSSLGSVGYSARWRVLALLGTCSYSLYLWHWPVLTALAEGGMAGVWGRLAGVALALLLAWLSWRWVEEPWRKGVWLMSARRSLAFCSVTVAVLVPLGLNLDRLGGAPSPAERSVMALRADRPSTHFEPCNADRSMNEAIPCELGAPEGPLVALVGDSHAEHWQPPLEQWALANGWRLQVITKLGCPMVDVTIFDHKLQGIFDGCTSWRANVLESLDGSEPDLVVVANYSKYLFMSDGARRQALDEREAWERGLTGALQSLSERAGKVVYIGDTPEPGFDVPVCLYREAGSEQLCDFARKSAVDASGADLSVAASVPGVTTIDLNDAFCSGELCSARPGGLVAYRDDDHLTASFTRSLSALLGSRIDRALGSD